jgi:uroporphyrinogen-III decarboxylase
MNVRRAMTNKQRVLAVLEGKPVDRPPVTSLYNFLYQQDHFSELTGLPQWRLQQWLAMPPEEHVEIYAQMQAAAPFELLQPQHSAPSRAWRTRQEFVEKDGHPFRHDRETGEWVQLDKATVSGHATDGHANEDRHVFTCADVDARVTVTPAAQQIADGANDYIEAIVKRFGRDEFIISGGVIGTIYSCHWHVGLTNLFSLLIEEPELIDYLCEKILAQNLEAIRRFAAAGGDAIYIDDATSTSDMISPAMYERFSLPYMKAMVDEIHRLKHKAILIYFGGIMDRLELIAATGADGLLPEASMKGFVNDTAEIARRIGDRMTLFSNIDPVAVLQNGTDADLEAEIGRQVAAGRAARGFILSTASPITPSTPLTRVQRFLELGRGRRMLEKQAT